MINDRQYVENEKRKTEAGLKAKDAAKKANSAVVTAAAIDTMVADDAAAKKHAVDINATIEQEQKKVLPQK